MITAPHLSHATLAAFIDDALDLSAREEVDAHLASCDECRAELIATSRAVSSLPARRTMVSNRRRTAAILATVAAAAILVTVALPRTRAFDELHGGAPVDRLAEERGPSITTIAPAEAASVSPASTVFEWVAQEGASYRVTITDESGGTIWSTNTVETSVRLPESVELASDSRFYWYVDALRVDGSSTSSGPRSFSTSAR